MTKIVITGASGNYGRLLTDKLIAKGLASHLILITRTPAKLAARAAAGCDVRFGDFDQPASLVPAIRGADRMLLISGTRVGARIPQHKAAIDAAVECGVKHIVYTSFIDVDVNSPAIVAIDHRETENMMRATECKWTMLRDAHYADAMIVNVGPGVIASGKWITSTKGAREAMVWREDCVNCAAAVLTEEGHENQAYEITGPNLESFADVARMLGNAVGRAIEVVETDDAGMYAHFDSLGIPRHPVDDQTVANIPWNSDDMVSFEKSMREGYLTICTDTVARLTGRAARSTQEMIDAHIDVLRAAAAG